MKAGGRWSGGRGGGRTAARLLAVCALLAGLFLMHGSPTSAGGCHEPAAPAPATAPHHTAADPAAPQHAAAPPTAPGPRLDGLRTAGGEQQAASCVSTRDRDAAELSPPAAQALAPAAALFAALGVPYRRRTDGPRAPPAAGRRLLLRVCVART
ncbi:hypothetical protein RMN57_20775 [Kitasatospora sp. CM 4170]|uniref:Secreted protein n=1 Tax=Kitasatospora aburaviensis TaxID=67265 RepID=A0ABW1F8U8_9ACTN|nr:hypothetical protein [Kitasatospora sp. CM 4170]WNM46960.1 hypothetical protein RMN57_20775 [Kitasatospora sp. CM 4170]